MANRKSSCKSEEISMEKIRDLFDIMFKKQEENILKILAANTKMFTEQMKVVNEKVQDIEKSIEFTHNETKKEMNWIRDQHRKEIDELREKVRDMEDRSRRNNIRIEGVRESENEDWSTTKEKIRDIFQKNLGIKQQITIERAHRGKRQGNKPRTIIAKILNYEEKELILANARKLKGSGIFIHEDFSRETVLIRQKLWEEVKQLREKGKYAILQYDRIFSRDFRK